MSLYNFYELHDGDINPCKWDYVKTDGPVRTTCTHRPLVAGCRRGCDPLIFRRILKNLGIDTSGRT